MKRTSVLLASIAVLALSGAASAEITGMTSGFPMGGLTLSTDLGLAGGADGSGSNQNDIVHTGDVTSWDNSQLIFNSCGELGDCPAQLELNIDMGYNALLNTTGKSVGTPLIIQHQIIGETGFSVCPDGCD